MTTKLARLQATLHEVLGERMVSLDAVLGELTLVVAAADYLAIATTLRDAPGLRFESAVDLAGMDYSHHGDGTCEFAHASN